MTYIKILLISNNNFIALNLEIMSVCTRKQKKHCHLYEYKKIKSYWASSYSIYYLEKQHFNNRFKNHEVDIIFLQYSLYICKYFTSILLINNKKCEFLQFIAMASQGSSNSGGGQVATDVGSNSGNNIEVVYYQGDGGLLGLGL